MPETLVHLRREAALHADVEVIAVDGGSTDNSVAIVAREPWIRTMDAPRGRAQQMNAGAAQASGDVLLFLHADTWLPEGALAAINEAACHPAFVYGGFTHRFSGQDRRLMMISALHNFRCRKAQTFYGDQAMFVRRDAFVALGGFPLQPIEDIALSQALKTRARPVLLPLCVTTSSRKFEQMGIWTSFARVLLILLSLRIGHKPPPAFFTDVR